MFVRTETQKWPEPLASLSTLTDTLDHVIVSNYLIAELAEQIDEAFIVNNLPTFIGFWGIGYRVRHAAGHRHRLLDARRHHLLPPCRLVGDLRDIVLETMTVFQAQLTVTSQELLTTCL
jgi:hypothetical protein